MHRYHSKGVLKREREREMEMEMEMWR